MRFCPAGASMGGDLIAMSLLSALLRFIPRPYIPSYIFLSIAQGRVPVLSMRFHECANGFVPWHCKYTTRPASASFARVPLWYPDGMLRRRGFPHHCRLRPFASASPHAVCNSIDSVDQSGPSLSAADAILDCCLAESGYIVQSLVQESLYLEFRSGSMLRNHYPHKSSG